MLPLTERQTAIAAVLDAAGLVLETEPCPHAPKHALLRALSATANAVVFPDGGFSVVGLDVQRIQRALALAGIAGAYIPRTE